MKIFKHYIFNFLVCVVLVMVSCTKENPEVNLSTVSTLSLEARDVIIPSFIIDNTGKYLLVCIRDLNYSNGIVKKINLSTLKVEAEFRVNGTVPISLTNILMTDKNEMVTTFFNFASRSMLIYKFDMNLNVVKLDTAARVYGGNFGRRRMVKSGPNRIIGVETNVTADDHFYLKYMTLDDNLNILNEKIDSSDEYGNALLVPQQFIKTSDGGTLYVGDNIDEPLYNDEILVEKRDDNFNLQWRTKYKTNGNNSASCVKEYNGKYYVYAHGEDNNFNTMVYMLVYDMQGNLIENKVLPREANVTKDAENMVITDNGDFLMLALSTLHSTSGVLKGLLYHSNSIMNNVTYKTFGGERNVQVSALIPMETNKYLLMYVDRSFEPAGTQPRLVFRFVDAMGNFIE